MSRKHPESSAAEPDHEVKKHVLCGVVSLLLVSFAFHPLDWWWLAWVAFVPWMAWHESAPRRGTGRALMAGYYLHFAYVLMWVGEIAPPLVWAIPLLGLPFVWACAWICDRCVHGLGMSGLVVYPLAIVSTELARDQVLALTWSSIGYTQWRWVEAIQSAAIFRVHLMSWVVLLVNAAIARWVVTRWWRGGGDEKRTFTARGVRRGLAVAAGAVVLLHVGGTIRMATATFDDGPRVGGVQGNIPQVMKLRGDRDVNWYKNRLLYRDRLAAEDVDVLVFAETSFRSVHDDVHSLEQWLVTPLRKRDDTLITENGRPVTWGGWLPRGRGQVTILGYNLYKQIDGEEVERNIAGAVVDGERIAEYGKRVLVPFGEYIPIPEDWPGHDWVVEQIHAAAGYVPGLTPGDGYVAVPVRTDRGEWSFGLSICYEVVFPGEFRGTMLEHAPDFLIQISNDGWYGTSNELDLVHVAARFRAVECGRSLVRVSNTGISTSIDPCGRYRKIIAVGGRTKEVSGTLVDTVQVTRGRTPWVLAGDLWAATAPLALLGLTLSARRRRGRQGFQSQPQSR